ncbi:MAG TPA: hypothetical protein VIL46_11385 [Gemmataceae bacterium]
MPRALSPDEIEALKRRWTDRYVRTRPGRPEYERFAGKVGRVVTVNWSGKALVDFADGAWYDIPASEDFLQVVESEEEKALYDATANSAQPHPARQG